MQGWSVTETSAPAERERFLFSSHRWKVCPKT